MADQNLLTLLETDLNEWNEQRDKSPIRGLADLSNANLRGRNLKQANLVACDLRNADFGGSDLRGACFIGSNVTGANFSRSKLSGARFQNANLTGANLSFSDLSGAALFDTNISKVDFTGAEPWKALLYSGRSGSLEQFPKWYPTGKKPIRTIGALIEAIETLQDKYTRRNNEIRFYFRGESKSIFKLQPSVYRNLKGMHIIDGYHERDILTDIVSRRPEDFVSADSALEQWGIAQHYRLPTRFLDVTRNPLIALFFACERDPRFEGQLHIFVVQQRLVKAFNSDEASIVSNIAKLSLQDQHRILGSQEHLAPHALYGIPERLFDNTGHLVKPYFQAFSRLNSLMRKENPSFDGLTDIGDLYKVFVIEPKRLSERIRAQSGAFLASAFHERFEREEIEKNSPNVPAYAHYKLAIPIDAKEDILKSLSLANITNESIMPGLDSSAEAVRRFYQL